MSTNQRRNNITTFEIGNIIHPHDGDEIFEVVDIYRHYLIVRQFCDENGNLLTQSALAKENLINRKDCELVTLDWIERQKYDAVARYENIWGAIEDREYNNA